jgi:hypothetical protein
MPAPRVFVSSTFYDLKYIRENLKFFIKSIGFEPVLSEEGSIFYDPTLHVQDACLAEIPSCQLFVLIIGGRHGEQHKEREKSITNAEYSEAARIKIPIFALIEQSVLDQNYVYSSNKLNPDIDETKISYPAVDSTKIFEFIEEVRGNAVNNALVPFNDFEDLQSYLKQQWASMMYHFLTTESEARRVGSLFEHLASATEKIEFMSEQIVQSVASPITKLNVEFYDIMLGHDVVHDLASWGLRPTPKDILLNETIDDICQGQIKINIEKDEDVITLTHGGPPYQCSKAKLERNTEDYNRLRSELLNRIKEKNIRLDKFIEEA